MWGQEYKEGAAGREEESWGVWRHGSPDKWPFGTPDTPLPSEDAEKLGSAGRMRTGTQESLPDTRQGGVASSRSGALSVPVTRLAGGSRGEEQ